MALPLLLAGGVGALIGAAIANSPNDDGNTYDHLDSNEDWDTDDDRDADDDLDEDNGGGVPTLAGTVVGATVAGVTGALTGTLVGAAAATVNDDGNDDEATKSRTRSKSREQGSRGPHRAGRDFSSREAAGIGAAVSDSATNYADNVSFGARQGHGFAAEKASHLFDKLSGKDARIVGGDNAKHGPDRIVDGVQIQTKYLKSGAKCVEKCFEGGEFKYFSADGSPMQIEVPSDMYEKAVKAMETRIEKGQMKGVSDPAMAKEIVRKGRFTYAQARNVARFGTVESLKYDAVNGVQLSAQAMGVSAALSFAVSIWNGDGPETALEKACVTGVKVGGIAWAGSILAAQLGRTGLEQALRGSTDWVVKQMGPKAASMLANALRSGGSIHGAAAASHASKLLRGNIVTGIATTVILSSADCVRMFQGRMSSAQLVKNVAVTASGVGGGVIGWKAGTAAGAAIGSVFPGVGTLIGAAVGGVAGAVGGSYAASEATTAVLDEFIEDDAKEMLKIVERTFATLCADYLLSEDEAYAVLDDFRDLDLPVILRDLYEADNRKRHARRILMPFVEEQVKARRRIALPSSEDMARQTARVLQQAAEAAK